MEGFLGKSLIMKPWQRRLARRPARAALAALCPYPPPSTLPEECRKNARIVRQLHDAMIGLGSQAALRAAPPPQGSGLTVQLAVWVGVRAGSKGVV